MAMQDHGLEATKDQAINPIDPPTTINWSSWSLDFLSPSYGIGNLTRQAMASRFCPCQDQHFFIAQGMAMASIEGSQHGGPQVTILLSQIGQLTTIISMEGQGRASRMQLTKAMLRIALHCHDSIQGCFVD